MSYQQNEEVISTYFAELLTQQNPSLDTVIDEVSSSNKAKSVCAEVKHKVVKPVVRTNIKTSALEGDSQQELKKDVFNNGKTEKQATSDSVTSEPISKVSKSSQGSTSSKANKPVTQFEKQKMIEPQPFLTADKPELKDRKPVLNLDTEEVKESAAYEQHKQRLEQMLKQVSGLEPETIQPGDDHPKALDNGKAIVDVLPDQDFALEEDVYIESFPALSSEWFENGRPNWAQERFDILLIEVNGLKLAVPLKALGHIQELDEDLTPLFGQSDWFMGLQKSPMGNIKTVNTAKFVMPERYQDEHDYKFVVSINGLHWGLAVDLIHQPISVDPDSIRWRANRSSRPWMAGMVKDHMCVLMDIPSMGEILQSQDKNHA